MRIFKTWAVATVLIVSCMTSMAVNWTNYPFSVPQNGDTFLFGAQSRKTNYQITTPQLAEFLRTNQGIASLSDVGVLITNVTIYSLDGTNYTNTIYYHGEYPAPIASFLPISTAGDNPITIVFTNLSENAFSYYWDFGDGNTSTAVNPTNTYINNGNYTVALTAMNPSGTNIFSINNAVIATNYIYIASMGTVGPSSGNYPLTVNFTSTVSYNGTNALTYNWDFADGHTSTNITPSHTYTNFGSYYFSLTVSDGVISNYYISLTPVEVFIDLVAGFSMSTNYGAAPLTIYFTNTSTYSGEIGVEYAWDFGDGTAVETNAGFEALSHTYTTIGAYTATLTASAPSANYTNQTTQSIEATNDLMIAFAADITSGPAPLTVTFTNLSTGSQTNKTFAWDFGNSSAIDTNETLVTATYDNAGTYAVSLIISTETGTKTNTIINYIEAIGPPTPGLLFAYDGTTNLNGTLKDLVGNGFDLNIVAPAYADAEGMHLEGEGNGNAFNLNTMTPVVTNFGTILVSAAYKSGTMNNFLVWFNAGDITSTYFAQARNNVIVPAATTYENPASLTGTSLASGYMALNDTNYHWYSVSWNVTNGINDIINTVYFDTNYITYTNGSNGGVDIILKTQEVGTFIQIPFSMNSPGTVIIRRIYYFQKFLSTQEILDWQATH